MSEVATNYFFDTSALVERYHDEARTAAVDEAFDGDAVCLISDLTVIECDSAFAKKVRTQEIEDEDDRVIPNASFRCTPALPPVHVETTGPVVSTARFEFYSTGFTSSNSPCRLRGR